MASVWEVSIDYSGVSFFTGTDNPAALTTDWTIHFRTICLPLTDAIPKYNPPVDKGHFSVRLGLAPPGSFMVLSFQLGDDEINEFYWATSLDFLAAFGTQADFLGGGTITITKDFDGNTLTVASPIGTI